MSSSKITSGGLFGRKKGAEQEDDSEATNNAQRRRAGSDDAPGVRFPTDESAVSNHKTVSRTKSEKNLSRAQSTRVAMGNTRSMLQRKLRLKQTTKAVEGRSDAMIEQEANLRVETFSVPDKLVQHKLIGSPYPIYDGKKFFTPNAYHIDDHGNYQYELELYHDSESAVRTEDMIQDIFEEAAKMNVTSESAQESAAKSAQSLDSASKVYDKSTPMKSSPQAAGNAQDEQAQLEEEQKKSDLEAQEAMKRKSMQTKSMRQQMLEAEENRFQAPELPGESVPISLAWQVTSPGSRPYCLDCPTSALREADSGAPDATSQSLAERVIATEIESTKELRSLHGNLIPMEIGASGKVKHLARVHPQELARQLSLSTAEVFSAVSHSEVEAAFAGENYGEGLLTLLHWEENQSMWLAFEILSLNERTARVVFLSRLISTAEYCLELHNYTDCAAIIRALTSKPVARLYWSWKALTAKRREALNRIQSVCSTANGCKTQQECVVPTGSSALYSPDVIKISLDYVRGGAETTTGSKGKEKMSGEPSSGGGDGEKSATPCGEEDRKTITSHTMLALERVRQFPALVERVEAIQNLMHERLPEACLLSDDDLMAMSFKCEEERVEE